ncbi:universal stress protein PHOS32-like isoform X2 [Carica papaya]|uniref:universal stress protein PHOS32-like isoform X2 n=1 Tax=Carica papaya TaxID=3649 RepID=UPI000B8CA0EE|nr:universal stress protein PHOS32-like isoform X2 [Carica papaya]
MATVGKETVIVGVDESESSMYALDWTLRHFFSPFASNPPFNLVIVYAKPLPSATVGLSGTAEVLRIIEEDLRRMAERVVETANQICRNKLVTDVVIEVVQGDARHGLTEAVERHRASLLVVGSHGYGAIKRALLGSVSDYCAHHIGCSVTIVKKPHA